MLTLLLAAALAADPPTVEVLGSDTVIGRVRVQAPAEEVRERLADPVWVVKVGGDGTSAVITSREGPCIGIDYTSPNAIMTARYAVRQCPKPDGYVQDLVTSNAFKRYRTTWKVVPSPEGGAAVEYRVELATSLLVPSSLVTRSTKNGVSRLLERLAAQLGSSGSR